MKQVNSLRLVLDCRDCIGSPSQQDIQINSSIAVNVTDLKRKINGLEQQLDEVSKHCQEIPCLEDCSKRDLESFYQSDLKHEIDTIKEQTEASSELKSNGIETQLLYKSSECNYKKSEESGYSRRSHNDSKRESRELIEEHDGHAPKVKSKKSKMQKIASTGSKLYKHKAKSVYDNFASVYSTSSFHSLANPSISYGNKSYYHKERKHVKPEYTGESHHHRKEKRYKESSKKDTDDHFKGPYEGKPSKHRKPKKSIRDVDPDFIADIIRKQYKPVKMFGRKGSNMSQFSVPVCRDQEFSIQENILEDAELCSCIYGHTLNSGQNHTRLSHRDEMNAMRSICDTRLYSCKKPLRHKDRRMPVDTYSNSDMYDLVPVKERSSPKTRRKFVEDNMIPYQSYREVPPSPRTLRPKLNLKAQYYNELEDYIAHRQHLKRRLPNRQKRYHDRMERFESDIASEVIPEIDVIPLRKPPKPIKPQVEHKQVQEQSHQDTGTMSSLQYPLFLNEQTSVTADTTLNKTQETETTTVDKTDKALCEIKDILQTFLHEIKKEAVASQSDKSDVSSKTSENEGNALQEAHGKLNNMMPNNTSYSNYNAGQCGVAPYMQPQFTNPCCYPVLPVCPCPMSVPNGYLVPNPSIPCTNCTNAPKECISNYCNKNTETPCPTETDELIKEIYKYVAQGPPRRHISNDHKERKHDDTSMLDSKLLTSRSVGGSYRQFQNDANVGTAPLKCFSKSCEAIGSRLVSDAYYSVTNASYSDTVLEKLSLEATTQSTSGTEMYDSSDQDKGKGNRFSKVLRSFGLFKKKKKDVIEELSETESVVDEEVKQNPPFRQEVTNYMMHGQDFYHAPPVDRLYQRPPDYPPQSLDYHGKPHDVHPRMHEYEPGPRDYPPRPYEYQPDYHPPYNPNARDYMVSPQQDPYGQRLQQRLHGHPNSPYAPRHRPSAPPFNSSYDTSSYSQMQPHLCLKEIEVKSTGTQSERKMSIFRKFKKRMQQPVLMSAMGTEDDYQRTFSTQTPRPIEVPAKPQINKTKPFFNWKNLQSKAMTGMQGIGSDPMSYSLKTQKELAEGDMKLRNAMLKKLFYKRNPFSPRNLVVRTLLGKDKSSFGEPPTMFRPRMFI
ncbi:uncharacterized protein LOC142987836 [Anticarsia gemmatalis]|uniref:uncharacterized protein LOC142987836 n=1 Tax=Anticarsia gemmatalis TaxID=129554 RepID=UPI003F75E97E